MIAYIEGRLAEYTDSSCILITATGLGYEVFIPSHSLATTTQKGQLYCLYTSQIVREDSTELFGFATWDERELFNLLITINRVGARTALAILSEFRPDDLRQIVWEQNESALTRVSGIGKKTGQQIFIELQYKLKVTAKPSKASSEPNNTIFKDALNALENLGYNEYEVIPSLKEVLSQEADLDLSGAIRACLKNLAQKK